MSRFSLPANTLIHGTHNKRHFQRLRIIGWDKKVEEHAKKQVECELHSLRKSFELAKADGYRKFIMFLHYPPTNILEERIGFTDMVEEYGAEQVIYAPCHGMTATMVNIGEGRIIWCPETICGGSR